MNDALSLARAGDLAGAVAAGEAALAIKDDAGLRFFVGRMYGQLGDVSGAIAHLRHAVNLAPDVPHARAELARALLAQGRPEETEQLVAPYAGPATRPSREMLRLRAHALARIGRTEEACHAYQTLVGVDAADFESLTGLASVLLILGDVPGAVAASIRATTLAPEAGSAWLVLANAELARGAFALAETAARKATSGRPDDPGAHLTLARALVGLGRLEQSLASIGCAVSLAEDRPALLAEAGDIAADAQVLGDSERYYRAALAQDPGHISAALGLGKLLERTSRLDELALFLAADDRSELRLLKARLLQRRGRLIEALAIARVSSANIDPAESNQLLGELSDRLGDPEQAFQAFAEANRLRAAAPGHNQTDACAYREMIAALTARLTPTWYANWSPPAPPPDCRSPAFIFGMPRSGTTLIDTMLIGHPDTVVLEEEPVIQQVMDAAVPRERLPFLAVSEIQDLRRVYVTAVEKIVPGELAGRLIVDKFPLGLVAAPLLHRLFPDARIVFVERHPCDVVLSCFFTGFRLNPGTANFLCLEDAANLYNLVLTYWQRVCDLLPLTVTVVRYEKLVAEPEVVLRELAAFLELPWDDRLTASGINAAGRSYISSPSYAQVAEPVYLRSAGRWRSYRRQLAPVLPVLEPWIERLGYDLDGGEQA